MASSLGISRREWTMTHGYFLGMGGFAVGYPLTDNSEVLSYINSGDHSNIYLPLDLDHLNLLLFKPSFSARKPVKQYGIDAGTSTSSGVTAAAIPSQQPNEQKQHHQSKTTPQFLKDSIPYFNISKEDILDKSKRDDIAKTIVCIQTIWFCLQCITRIGLPITLLEFNTFEHAVCTLLIYVLWWHKPMDIRRPTVLSLNSRDPQHRALWAFLNSRRQVRDRFSARSPLDLL
ncbi:hypothetical protein B0H63DRAFT_523179 [Podospora didyma]|uniref:Uncharacterized protein n=1 Tax=Podospora didyma TaxID=330526 RepID=A0AAE0NQL6_9PEZI|nr:hypothetical protein B0H63DRAFT_523179 [Podospora didyma]